MNKLILTTVLILIISSCEKKEDSEKWITYTSNNSGLIYNTVNAIAIDAKGNKWFGTDKGISKFDGQNWTNYDKKDGLTNICVTAIAIDRQGNTWFGTRSGYYDNKLVEGGLFKFDGSHWSNYNETNGLASNQIVSIAIDKSGNVWVGCYPNPENLETYKGGGLSKFDGTHWTTYSSENCGLLNNNIGPIVFDSKGNMWVGNQDGDIIGGLSKFDGTNWTVYKTGSNGSYLYGINTMAIDAKDNIWVGGNSLNRFDGINWFAYYGILQGGKAIHIAVDKQDNKWIVAYDGQNDGFRALVKFDGKNSTAYTEYNSGLVSDGIRDIIVDTEGNKWFGTGAGISELLNQ